MSIIGEATVRNNVIGLYGYTTKFLKKSLNHNLVVSCMFAGGFFNYFISRIKLPK